MWNKQNWSRFSLLLAVVGQLQLTSSVKRGPHHPRSELSTNKRVDQYLTHEEHDIQEELHSIGVNVNLEEMTEAEKNVYYFKVHDNDRNSALDGLEMLQAALHSGNSFKREDRDSYLQNATDEFNNIIQIIDEFLLIADTNKDGLLHYSEYMKAVSDNKAANDLKI